MFRNLVGSYRFNWSNEAITIDIKILSVVTVESTTRLMSSKRSLNMHSEKWLTKTTKLHWNISAVSSWERRMRNAKFNNWSFWFAHDTMRSYLVHRLNMMVQHTIRTNNWSSKFFVTCQMLFVFVFLWVFVP